MRIQISFTRELTLAAVSGAAQYYDTIESLLQSAKTAEKARIEEMVKSMELNAEVEFTEWNIAMQEHEATFDMLLPNFFRYSFITLLLLIVENRLNELCYAARTIKRLTTAPPQPKKDIIRGYKEYISNEARISGLDWDALHELSKVRNCIVHRSGRVKGFRNESFLRQLTGKRAGLYVSNRLRAYERELQPLYLEDDMLVIEPEYCRYMLDIVKAFLEDLCDKIPLPRLVIDP
jgi:hypothetical protein